MRVSKQDFEKILAEQLEDLRLSEVLTERMSVRRKALETYTEANGTAAGKSLVVECERLHAKCMLTLAQRKAWESTADVVAWFTAHFPQALQTIIRKDIADNLVAAGCVPQEIIDTGLRISETRSFSVKAL